MNDKRRARRAKQARRDARRARKRNAEDPGDTTFRDAIRRAMAGGHPLGLLSLASYLIHVAKPDPLDGETYLDNVLTGLIGVRTREMTALLTVIAELLVDDPAPQLRCRQELADRHEHLPRWITALPQAHVYRAVRRTDVLGDVDELVIGMRFNSAHELTVAVLIDHNMFSGIADAAAVPDPIDEALARATESSSDTHVVEMKLADARAWIEEALTQPTLIPKTDTWPLYRALVRWLVDRLPEGGEHRSPAMDWEAIEELCDRFFATDSASPFTDAGHRELLLELLEDDRDPLRWSDVRVELAIGSPYYSGGTIPLEVVLDAPTCCAHSSHTRTRRAEFETS
ncbi:hypothetical protein M2272_004652 [Mycobacterium frederiksbergense]|uniref:Uncharacterized protein n=1 Tax=Mycolicibacterium frederiksbergense TaxID=117567 RepID=A0ABT6L4W0_9MYCO|nr:hypothetical protein [Mycolicibacterium frederiksbergense]MDH6197996.1 hypothetical protein [Mycolicibacterium frederiksbergense]